MQQSFRLMYNINQLPQNLKRQVVDFLAYSCREIVENKIRLAYSINSNKRHGDNFISLEDMLGAVTVDVSYVPFNLFLFIDEEKILWEKGRNSRRVGNDRNNSEGFAFSYQDSIVGGSEGEHNSREDAILTRQNDWVLSESLRDIRKFIDKDFKFYLENKILRK